MSQVCKADNSTITYCNVGLITGGGRVPFLGLTTYALCTSVLRLEVALHVVSKRLTALRIVQVSNS